MNGNIPFVFDYWAYQGVLLRLLKCSTSRPTYLLWVADRLLKTATTAKEFSNFTKV